MLHLVLNNKVVYKQTWLVDIVAAFSLLYCTYGRTEILDGKNTADCQTVKTSGNAWVSKYFILSVASWISLIILEARTCLQIFTAVFGKFHCPIRSVVQVLKFCVIFFLASNSVVVMLHFCTDVHQSFEYLTNETMFILYYWIAALVKTFSVFMQSKCLVYFHIFVHYKK